MGLKKIVLKIIFHAIVDVEATQGIKNPVPEEQSLWCFSLWAGRDVESLHTRPQENSGFTTLQN